MTRKWRDVVLVLVIICLLMLAVVQPRFTIPALLIASVGVYNLVLRYSRR